MENKDRTRLVGMLGFAMRAGRVIIGTELVCRALSRVGDGSVKLVILAADASEGTKKKVLRKCEFYGKEAIVTELSTDELGRLLGKTYAPATVAVTDAGFAAEIIKVGRN